MAKRSSFRDLTAEERAEFAARMRAMVEAIGTQAQAAEVAGVSVRQLKMYLSGESAPAFLPIGRLAERSGFSLHWVMTGHGARSAVGTVKPTDPELLGRVVDTIARVYREERVQLPNIELGRIAGEVYDEIVSLTEDPEQRLGALKHIEKQTRDQIRVERPTSRKRGA